MLYLRYIAAELRRRKGRTVLTALGLAVGVGLVVTVTALSAGLDNAQSKVLDPLTGVGTDMSVKRPLTVSGSGDEQTFGPPGAPGSGLSQKEQKQLERENGGAEIGLTNLGKPGERFSNDSFMSSDLSFPASKVRTISSLDGVDGAAGGLTLNAVHVSGRVPKQAASEGPRVQVAPPGGEPPNSLNFDSFPISGIDVSKPDVGQLTRSQVEDGSYFKGSGAGQAVLSKSYANENDLSVGDTVTVADKKFDVVGIANPTAGGSGSDVYIELGRLQRLADRDGRVNVVSVRATSADDVDAVSSEIESTFKGSEVTTSSDLADQVSGSLVDAKNLSSKLGTALAVVALLAAFGIASLLTLSSVNKRTRELGTLKAIGWRQWPVIRQVTGESVVQGLLGGLAGAVIGIGGAAIVGALGISLDASISPDAAGPAMLGPGGGSFGQGAVDSTSSTVSLGAPVDAQMILLAIGLAVIGGLIAGAIGGMRAARLRPAEALRSVE
jgi:ABC-type antimicrobial peptide transport system permease subunit